MSVDKQASKKDILAGNRIRSVRTLFLLVITGVTLFLALIFLWAGIGIMNSVISGFAAETMHEKLNALLHPIGTHYATLTENVPEGSGSLRSNKIQETALKEFADFSYKNSGSLFIVDLDQSLILSRDFQSGLDPDFADFFALLESASGTMEYSVGGRRNFTAYQLYLPWDSYIGLTIDKKELFAPKNQFIRISLMLVTVLLLATILFSGFIQRLIITPLIRYLTGWRQVEAVGRKFQEVFHIIYTTTATEIMKIRLTWYCATTGNSYLTKILSR